MKVTKFQRFINILIRLTNRELEIVELRFIKRRQLEEIAELFNITLERVRQIISKVEEIINEELT